MNKILLFLVCFVFWTCHAIATSQDQGAFYGTLINTADKVESDITGFNSATIQVSGSGSGTITAEVYGDKINTTVWQPIQVWPQAGGIYLQNISANGFYSATITGCFHLRIRAIAMYSGQFNIYVTLNQGPNPINAGLPVQSYIVTIPNITPPSTATDAWGIYNPPGSGVILEAIDAKYGSFINGGGSFPAAVYRRTALDSGGNSTNVTIGTTDPAMPAASFTAAYYTSNPTNFGGVTSTVSVYEFQANTNSIDDPLLADGVAWFLRPGQVWYMNLNQNTVGGISHTLYIRQLPPF